VNRAAHAWNAYCIKHFKTKGMDKKKQGSEAEKAEDKKFPLPEYPKGEDIYSREKEESLDALESKKQRLENKMSEDLDVPGAELDDQDELIGEEDEENNYYSLGGDDQNALEENKE
jgi:hypothetical protein